MTPFRCGPPINIRDWRALENKDRTRAERAMAFVERHCRVPEGALVGKPIKLARFQEAFFYAVYDNPAGTRRAYLSMARKNSKTATIACIVLVHLVGPEAKQNSQILSGARSREQAAIVHALASKMVQHSPELSKLVRIIPSGKRMIGLPMNVEYRALSAEAGTAHGLSGALAIIDEAGQIRGERDEFVDAITTSQGAHDAPLLIVISTQAPTDNDLFSRWLDDAEKSQDPSIVSHLYAAPNDCALDDPAAWEAANPAVDLFRSRKDIEEQAKQALRMPAAEASFRNLILNQRIDASSPFVARGVWNENGAKVKAFGKDVPLYGGLDLSTAHDLTALVLIGRIDNIWHVRPTFWLPADGLAEKARKDRVPYDVWQRDGHLLTAPGKSVDYEFVATVLRSEFERFDIRKIAFDRWGMKHLRPWLLKAGFTDEQIEAHFVEFGQGFQSMSPALRDLEGELLNGRVAHGSHPVLTMCAANAVVQTDPAGNRKLAKHKSAGRIDGMVALTMAMGVAPMESVDLVSVYETRGALVL